MAITLKQAFDLNGTPDLDSFNDLQEQCKNTDYFSNSKPINHLSSWEGYWYGTGYTINVSLSKTSVSAAEETITATYTIKQNTSTGDVVVSGVKPTVTNSLGSVSDITSTNSSGVGTCKIKVNSRGTTIGNERAGSVLVAYEGSSKTVNYNQAGNYVTKLVLSSNGAMSFSYPTASAAGETISANVSGGWTRTFTFTSGATSNSSPNSTYITSTSSKSFSGSASGNFAKPNSSTGSIVVTGKGASASGVTSGSVVTRTYTQTITHTSAYSAGGTVSSTGGVLTATPKQAANVANAYYGDLTATASYGSKNAAQGTISPTLSVKCNGYYTSGSKGAQATLTSSNYTIAATMTTGNGASIASTTGVITWEANTGSARTSNTATLKITTKSPYLNYSGSALTVSPTAKSTQSADSISSYKYLVVDLSYANAAPSTANVTVNPSLTVKATPVYVSGKSASQVTIPSSGYSVSYTESTASSYASVSSAGVITWNSNAKVTSDRTVGITANVTCNSTYSGLAGSDVATAKHTKDSIKTYGDVTVSIGTGITAANGSATVSGAQTLTWNSGDTSTGTITYAITKQYIGTSSTATSGTNITRYSLSGTKLSHTTMGTNTGYDIVVVTATGQGSKTKTAQTSVYNGYTDSGGVTSTTYGNWGGGAISFNSTTALSAAADSRTVTIQPFSRTKTVSTTAKIRTWDSGSTQTITAASSNNSPQYYTGLIDMSCSSTYGTFDTSQFSGSETAKSVTLTKATYGSSPTSSTSWTIKATPKDTTIAATSKTISVTKNVLSAVVASVKSGTTPVPYTGGSVTLQCKATLTTGTFVVTPTWSISSGVATLSSTSAKNPTLTYSSNSSSERTTKVIATYKNTSSAELSVKQSAAPVGWTLPIDFYVQSTMGVSGAADCSFKCSGDVVLGAQSPQAFSFNSGLIRDYYYTSGSFKESKVLNLASLNVTTNTTNFSDYHLDWGFALHASGGYGSSTSSTIQYKLYWQVEKSDGTIYELMSTSYPKTSTNYVSVDYLTTNESQTQSTNSLSITNGDRIRITIVI